MLPNITRDLVEKFQSTRPRRARLSHPGFVAPLYEFQSTRPRRARPVQSSGRRPVLVFQSTRPRRARRASGKVDANARRFNPRARVGRDAETMPGVTVTECFNPRARVGRDDARGRPGAVRACFNPRARVGRDPCCWNAMAAVSEFQSTRPRRARPQGSQQIGRQEWLFQSTRPRRARLSHHNSLRDKDFFYEIREPMSPVDPKGTGQVATTQKANEINKLLKCEPSRESRAA